MIKNKLQIKKLFCARNEKILFSDLNCTVESGNVLQIIGNNGSGKTSLLRILAGLFTAFSGDVLWQEQSITMHREQYLQSMLYIGHQHGMKMSLTPYENLLFTCALQMSVVNTEHVLHALSQVDLADFSQLPLQQLSAGQQRRVALARLLLSAAPLWLLDEPFIALDEQGKTWVEQLITNHVDHGGMVILSAHQPLYFIEAQRLVLRGSHVATH